MWTKLLLRRQTCSQRNLAKGRRIDVNAGSGHDEKKEGVPEEGMPMKHLTFKRKKKKNFIFHHSESTKDEMLETDPNLERSVTICQGREKMLHLYYKLHNQKKQASAVQTTLDKCFPKGKTQKTKPPL